MIMVIKGVEIEFMRILTVFTTIDLSSNKFEGEIPAYIHWKFGVTQISQSISQ